MPGKSSKRGHRGGVLLRCSIRPLSTQRWSSCTQSFHRMPKLLTLSRSPSPAKLQRELISSACPQSHYFWQYPELITVGGSWNIYCSSAPDTKPVHLRLTRYFSKLLHLWQQLPTTGRQQSSIVWQRSRSLKLEHVGPCKSKIKMQIVKGEEPDPDCIMCLPNLYRKTLCFTFR